MDPAGSTYKTTSQKSSTIADSSRERASLGDEEESLENEEKDMRYR